MLIGFAKIQNSTGFKVKSQLLCSHLSALRGKEKDKNLTILLYQASFENIQKRGGNEFQGYFN